MTAVSVQEPVAAPAAEIGTIEAREFSFWYGKKQAHEIQLAVLRARLPLSSARRGRQSLPASITPQRSHSGIRQRVIWVSMVGIFDKKMDVGALRQGSGWFQRWILSENRL